MSRAAAPREAYHHGQLRTAALDAAEALIEQDADISLRALAGGLGVAHRALYNHFGDRAGLLAALAARGFERLADAVAGAGSAEAFVRAYAGFALARPGLYALMMRQTYRAFETDPALRVAADRLISVALRVLAPGAPDADSGRRAVMRLWMLVHGGLALHAGGALRTRSDEDFVTELLAIAGLAPASPEPPVQPLWPTEAP
jgi:AcrR family transcriptional regulator